MKTLKIITALALIAAYVAAPVAGLAADKDKKKEEKAKPYPLKTCIVSDEKLGGDHGDPYVFTHNNQEIKLCCKSCKEDFDKAPAKYLKKIAKADKPEKK